MTVAKFDEAALELEELRCLMSRVQFGFAKASNRKKDCMTGFVISGGGYAKPLLVHAKTTARKMGKVEVAVGEKD